MMGFGNGTPQIGPNGKPVPKRLRKRNNVRFAIGVLLIAIVGCYLGFTKNIPFTGGYRFNAVFTSANSIRIGSPVRIAGVDVGKVVEVSRYEDSSSAKVTMEMQDNGLPIHKDAQLKIRPRIFLEGNFFVDLRPGTPEAPDVSDGGTIPVTQTSTPVQLDQVLTSLQYKPREDLQVLLTQLGVGLDTKPTAAENAQVDPEVRNTTGGEALNKALKYTPAAFKGTALVNQGFLGKKPDDLSKFVVGLWKFSAQLGAKESVLSDFITNFDVTMGAFASQAPALKQSIGLLGPTLQNTYTALGTIDSALPNVSAFAIDLIPAVKETPATINAAIAGGPGTPSWANSWANQARLLLSAKELGASLNQLVPTTVSTAQLIPQQTTFNNQTRDVSKCFADVVLPTGDQVISDSGPGYDFNPLASPAYKEFWYSLVGLAGESQNYDGNGQFIRLGVGGAADQNSGALLYPPSDTVLDKDGIHPKNLGNIPTEPLGTSPRYFGKAAAPAYKPTVKCATQGQPNLNDPIASKAGHDIVGPNPDAGP